MKARILISGGIGSGKSVAAGFFEAFGAVVISADEVGHAVLEPGAEAYDEVSALWPQAVSDGQIDRSALAEIVFADHEQLRALEAITHPAIAARIEREANARDGDVIAVEIPLLKPVLGDGWFRIVVDAPDETRKARLRNRGMEDADITGRMAAQPGRAEWLRAADAVLDNAGGVGDLEVACRRLWDRINDD